MDRIAKELRKLSADERMAVRLLLVRIYRGDLFGLDVKKLVGRSDIYRVRKGRVRIIYRQSSDHIFILTIERRSEKTYRDFD